MTAILKPDWPAKRVVRRNTMHCVLFRLIILAPESMEALVAQAVGASMVKLIV